MEVYNPSPERIRQDEAGVWWYYWTGDVNRTRATEKECKNCGRPFLCGPNRDKAFCNRSCAAQVNTPFKNKKGAESWRWKGGRTIIGGYVYVTAPEGHPYPNAAGYIREHRLVMEGILGRCLQPWEEVHHKNLDKLDNSPGNLQLRTKGHGSGAILCCADCGSRNIVGVDL